MRAEDSRREYEPPLGRLFVTGYFAQDGRFLINNLVGNNLDDESQTFVMIFNHNFDAIKHESMTSQEGFLPQVAQPLEYNTLVEAMRQEDPRMFPDEANIAKWVQERRLEPSEFELLRRAISEAKKKLTRPQGELTEAA